MVCKICGKEVKEYQRAKILNKYTISYYYCEKCNFLQTENPFWLEEAYLNPINSTDTGILDRNYKNAKIASFLILLLLNRRGIFVDFAGGFGIFTRMMRDIGFDFYWLDSYAENIFARGFKYKDIGNKDVELVTAFECFEHFSQPLNQIETILEISNSILFTTELLTKEVPKPNTWWYYGLEHGQHISFYSVNTLSYIAEKYRLQLYTDGKYYHIMTKRKINPCIFRAIIKLKSLLYLPMIKAVLKSKTFEDMYKVKELLTNNKIVN